jgi:hypothetical protein
LTICFDSSVIVGVTCLIHRLARYVESVRGRGREGKTYYVDLTGVDAEEEGAGGEEEADCGGELHFEVGSVVRLEEKLDRDAGDPGDSVLMKWGKLSTLYLSTRVCWYLPDLHSNNNPHLIF